MPYIFLMVATIAIMFGIASVTLTPHPTIRRPTSSRQCDTIGYRNLLAHTRPSQFG